MMMKVIGHKAPDTDTVCSPLAYAWYLNTIKNIEASAYIAGELNKETQFVLNHFKIEEPEIITSLTENDKVIVMDTNNPDELLDGIRDASIEGIVDHHKLTGGLSTEKPIPILIEPIACTATIVWNEIKRSSYNLSDVPREIVGVMLAAIVSDTLKFTSPTTTEIDVQAAHELAQLCNEDIDILAEGMFAAKSDLTGMAPRTILTVDSKIFEFGDTKTRISVLETTLPQNALDMKNDLRSDMKALVNEEELDMIFFFVVDIIEGEATLLIYSDKEKDIASKAFNTDIQSDTVVLPGVLSRKKQIVPALEPVIVKS